MVAVLAFLLLAALAGLLGSTFVLLGTFLATLGVIVLVRGTAPKFGIQRRGTGGAVLVAGLYIGVLGAATMATIDDVQPTALVVGEECEVIGTTSNDAVETLYCMQATDEQLIWATAEDFKAAHPEVELLSEEALRAAEERATEAEARVEELEEELQNANSE